MRHAADSVHGRRLRGLIVVLWRAGPNRPLGRDFHAAAALSTRPPFDNEALRRELAERLNSIPGVQIPERRLAKRPAIE